MMSIVLMGDTTHLARLLLNIAPDWSLALDSSTDNHNQQIREQVKVYICFYDLVLWSINM